MEALDRFAEGGTGDVRALAGRWKGNFGYELATFVQSSVLIRESSSFASCIEEKRIADIVEIALPECQRPTESALP